VEIVKNFKRNNNHLWNFKNLIRIGIRRLKALKKKLILEAHLFSIRDQPPASVNQMSDGEASNNGTID
tara:strand:- start:135 stop:338 length:204 start_codon:yes stop_codon:yes gene_type:complete